MAETTCKYNRTKKGFDIFVPEKEDPTESSSHKTIVHAYGMAEVEGGNEKGLRAQVTVTKKI